jgi:hypothetical protein
MSFYLPQMNVLKKSLFNNERPPPQHPLWDVGIKKNATIKTVIAVILDKRKNPQLLEGFA